ncbi:hypothetical protein Tco_0684119 [Tanacetum coccineum]
MCGEKNKIKLFASEGEAMQGSCVHSSMTRRLCGLIVLHFETRFLGASDATGPKWTEVGESRLLNQELVQETTEKIFRFKKRAENGKESRQKSNADNRLTPGTNKVIHDTLHVSNLKKLFWLSQMFRVPLDEIRDLIEISDL